LPLPTGLIGTADPVAFDYQACRPCFPFLSLSQVALVLVIYAAITGLFSLFAPRGSLLFAAGGALIGMLPSIWEAVPSRLVVRTPRPQPWADFTREWVALSRYKQRSNDIDTWLPDNDVLEVEGARRLLGQLKRNFDRISARGHQYN
jgi:hypothetical protein